MVTSVAYMRDLCRRLEEELRGEGVARLRSREIETLIRLLVPSLIQALAEGVHQTGPTDRLQRARDGLHSLRQRLDWVAAHRDSAPEIQIHRALLRIVADVESVLVEVDRD